MTRERDTYRANEKVPPIRNEFRVMTREQVRREELVWLHGLATDRRVLRRIERELLKLVNTP